MTKRALAILLTLALAAAACGGSDRKKTPLQSLIAPNEGVAYRLLEAEFEFAMSGAVEAEWSGRNPLNIVTNVGAGTPRALWILTVGILADHVLKTDDGIELRPAFDLVGYHGEDDYEIVPERAGGLTDEELEEIRDNPEVLAEKQKAGNLRDAAFVIVTRDGTTTEFINRLEPCTIKLRHPHALRGSVRCPRVANADGEQVSFEWSWRADAEKVAASSTTSPPNGRTTGTTGAVGNTSTTTTSRGSSGNGEPEEAPGIKADFPLDVTVDPNDCAGPGRLVVVEVETIPDAAITLVMAYSDAGTHGNTILGTTGPGGDFNWAFAVSPTVPDGPARLLVNVTAQDNSRTGGGIVDAFEVRRTC